MEGIALRVPNNEVSRSLYRFGRAILIIILACIFLTIQSHYVARLFENDRQFSMLSNLEREMSFRSEVGFYYSYYKTVTDEQPYLSAIAKLVHDKKVEYPNEINAFSRFNVHPEVLLGSLYRYLEPSLNESRTCLTIDRGEHLEPVESCSGLGEPIIFYVHAVWISAGLTVAVLFVYATLFSDNILGGLFAIGHYFMNHASCTRAMWSPGQREGWTHAPLLLQMCLLTVQLRRRSSHHALYVLVAIFLLNCCCLLFWQFSQFIFLTQTFIFFMMEQLRIIDLKTFCVFLHAHFCGLQTAVLLLHNNDMLKTSLYTSFFIVVSIYCLLFSSLRIKVRTRFDFFLEASLVVLRVTTVVAMSIWLKKALSDFLGVDEDTHVWEILLSKISSYKTFHTMLYTCSDVFDFMPLSTWAELWDSSLLPLTLVCVVNSIVKWLTATRDNLNQKIREAQLKEQAEDSDADSDSGIDNNGANRGRRENQADGQRKRRRERKSDPKQPKNRDEIGLVDYMKSLEIDASVFYNISQMVVFGMMATLVMRLKLLFVPQMCLIVSLVPNFHPDKIPLLNRLPRWLSRVLFYLMLIVPVVTKVRDTVIQETSNIGEFHDLPLEELLTWVSHRSAGAVYAGPMTVTSAVLLSTRRAIVNHPHYEHREARDRTYAVYKVYGRFTPQDLYQDLTKLRVTYLIVDRNFCYGKSSTGCTLESIWDATSPAPRRPRPRPRPTLCHVLMTRSLDHFYAVFQNEQFTVFRVHDYSVRYMPRSYST